MTQDLPKLARQVIEATESLVHSPNAPKRASLTSAVMTAFRPYVDAELSGAPPPAANMENDMRRKPWLISLSFWRAGQGGEFDILEACSDGRDIEEGGNNYGGEICEGLGAAAELIADFAHQLGANHPDFEAGAMYQALNYLRSTISRQGGRATMRRTSGDGQWHLVCDVFREDSFPKEGS